MNAPNRPQLGDIRTMPIGEIAALPAAVLALLQEEAEEAAKAARSLADWLNGAIALRYGDRAAAARRAEGKDTGTVRFDDDEVTVIADLPKKVEWDQAELATLVAAIRAEDGDPGRIRRHRVPRSRAQVRRLAAPHPHRLRAGAHGEGRQAHVSGSCSGRRADGRRTDRRDEGAPHLDPRDGRRWQVGARRIRSTPAFPRCNPTPQADGQRLVHQHGGVALMAISLASLRQTTSLTPPRILIHGVAGVGKTTFAAKSDRPVIIATEEGLGTLDVPHFPLARRPSTRSWSRSTRSTTSRTSSAPW